MKFNVFVELDSLKKFLEFSGEFFEIIIRNNSCFFYSQSTECEDVLAVNLLDRVNTDVSVRLSTSFIKGLKDSCRIGVDYSNKLKLTFFDKNGLRKYSVETMPQKSICDLNKLLERLSNKDNYSTADLSKTYNLSKVLATSNLRFNCLEEVCYGKIDEGYVFSKIKEFPNLCLPAKQIQKLSRISNKVYLVESNVFACSDNFSVFYNLYRNDVSCDLVRRLKQKFLFSVELNVGEVREYLDRFKSDDYLEFDLDNKIVSLDSEGLVSKINIDVKNYKSYEKKDSDDLSDDELSEMLNSINSFVTLDSVSKSIKPTISIKSNLIQKYFNSNKCTIYSNSNILVITLDSYSLVVPNIGG